MSFVDWTAEESEFDSRKGHNLTSIRGGEFPRPEEFSVQTLSWNLAKD